MPPKKTAKAAKPANDDPKAASSDVKQPPGHPDQKANGTSKDTTSNSRRTKKRKEPPTSSREGSRKSSRTQPQAQPSPSQLIRYLLSPSCAALIRPKDEENALSSSSKPLVTYTSHPLNPFQELISAIVLSRPISHTLGLRTIRTLFNPPYSFTGAKSMSDAGGEKLHKALWDARTQHKAKTADQLHAAADVLLEVYTADDDTRGEGLGRVLGRKDVDAALGELAKGINGLGPTGCGIFRRRVQWLWKEAYPFVDGRSGKGLRALGLPDDGEEIVAVIDEHWGSVNEREVAGKDGEQKRRRALAVVLEMATGADLEGKVDEVLREAAKLEQ